MPWAWGAGALCASVIALVTAPAGVSGAVLPPQSIGLDFPADVDIDLLHETSPSSGVLQLLHALPRRVGAATLDRS